MTTQKRTQCIMVYRATTGTIKEPADATALDEHDDSASLLYDQPYDDENSYHPHDDIHSLVLSDPHNELDLRIPVSELVQEDLADELMLLSDTLLEDCRAGLRTLLLPTVTTTSSKPTAVSSPPSFSSSFSSGPPGILRTKVFQRRPTSSSSLSTTTASTTPTTPLFMLTDKTATTTTTSSMANNASVEIIVGRKKKTMEKRTKPNHQLASLFSSWMVPSVFSKQQQSHASSRPNMTLLSAAIKERHVIVDDVELPHPNDTRIRNSSSFISVLPFHNTVEVVPDSSLVGNGNDTTATEDHNSGNIHRAENSDTTEAPWNNPIIIRTTTEAIELTHPEITVTHPAPTTVCTTYHVIETQDHTEVVVIDGASTERMTTTHISEEEDGGWVPQDPSNLEDTDAVVSSTTTTTVDCVDHREVVQGDGNISLIPTIIGNDHDENQEVSVEDYIETTMVSTKFHTVSPDSDRTENNGSFQPHEDRRRVHFVECEAIEEVGINGDDDRIHTFHIGDTPNNEHDENRNHTRPTAINTPSPRQKCANTDGTTKHVVAFTRKTVPRVGQHRGPRKNTRPSEEKTHVQPNKRTRR